MIRWVLGILLLGTAAGASEPLSDADLANLRAVRRRERLLYEAYLQDPDGLSGVFGYNFDRYFRRNTFFELAIFGAVSGKRGGYGIAAFGLGQRFELSDRWEMDIKAVAGSGGGGGLKAGGGLAWHGSSGFAVRVADGLFVETRLGYLSFPTGPYDTATLAGGLSFDGWDVELGD